LGQQIEQGVVTGGGRTRQPKPRTFGARFVLQAAGIALLACWCHGALPTLDPQTSELIRQGDMADARGDTKAALASFEQADKLSPNRPEILVRISKQYLDVIGETSLSTEAQKAAQNSLDYAKRAVDLDPKCAKAHLSLAVGYGRMTDFADTKTRIVYSKYVKEETEKSLALDPTDAFAYHVLGKWNYSISNLNPMLRLMAKLVYGGLPDASMEDAAKDLKKATDLAPLRIIHHYELARTYKAMGKFDLATKEWETVLALHADNKADEAEQKEAREALKEAGHTVYDGADTHGLTASTSQPARKQSPPTGVMNTSQRGPDTANK